LLWGILKNENKMGPLRFELRSEDPQSPRMARLPYGPAFLLLDHITYVSYVTRYGMKKIIEAGSTGSDIAPLKFLDAADEVIKLCIRDLDLALNGIHFLKQLAYAHVHKINYELLDNDNASEQDQHVSFVSHDYSKNSIT
jgi:hypothetical protein